MNSSIVAAGQEVRRRIQKTQDLVGSIRSLGGSLDISTTDTLFERRLEVTGTGAALLALLPQIGEGVALGHEFDLLAASDQESFEVLWRSGAAASISGSPDLVLDVDDRARLRQACDADDVETALRLLGDHRFVVRGRLAASDGGTAWVPSLEALTNALSSGSWVSVLVQMEGRVEGRRAVLLVDDLHEVVRTPRFVFAPVADPLPPADIDEDDGEVARVRAFCAPRLNRGWPPVPAPGQIMPATPATAQGPAAQSLTRALAGAASALVWLWLASEKPEAGANQVRVTYRGVRDFDAELVPSVGDGVHESAMALWAWVSANGEDPLRVEAVEQALTLAAGSAGEVQGAAAPALRTAQTLHRLSVSGTVAEALSARRASRDAAFATAQASAGLVSETAGKALERSLTLTVAAAATVFATLQEVITRQVSAAALVALAILLCGGLWVARTADLAAAERALDAFDRDLDGYRESMGEEEVQFVRNLEVLANARDQIDRLRCLVTVIYAVSAAAAVLLAIGLALF